MWTWILIAALLIVAVAFWRIYRRQRGEIAEIDKARERIQLEEARVFNFLHGLGEALSVETRPEDLYRLIVEGARRIAEGDAAALYLPDRNGGLLRPAVITDDFPPLVEVPARCAGSPTAVLAHLKLRSISPGEGAIGEAWQSGATLLKGNDPLLQFGAQLGQRPPSSAIICPLVFGSHRLGLLALTRRAGNEPFQTSEFQLVKALGEQSAFALYNLIVFSEAAEKRRLELDLQNAREIQRILLPTSAPDIDGFQITGLNLPARHVSGDYYDYILVDDRRWGVAIADVSGKGIPASLIMAMARSVLRSQAPHQRSPAEVLSRVNEQLYPDIKEDMFISMAYVILEKESSTVKLCRAGHDAPLHFHAGNKSVTKVKPSGMAVGIDSGGAFNRVTGDFSLTLEPGDCLIFYTDGITEAIDADGEEFGMERVIAAIQASADEGAAGILTRLTDDLRAFIGNQPLIDDVTLIVIRKK